MFLFIALVFGKFTKSLTFETVLTNKQNIKYNFISANQLCEKLMKFRKFSVLLLVIIQLACLTACKTTFVNDPEKKARKQQEKDDKAFKRSYEKIQQAHLKNQTKETRKRMKKNQKRAKKRNKKKKKKNGWDCN